MQQVKTQPAGAPRRITIDRCENCGGHWFDAGEAKYTAPFFANLQHRHVEIAALGTPNAAIAGCPRCNGTVHMFRLIDLELDYCLDCNGVWVDGHEAADRVQLKDGAVASGHIYRTVQRSQSLEFVSCAICTSRTAVAECYMAGAGLVCRSCHFAILQRKQELAATEAGEAPLMVESASSAMADSLAFSANKFLDELRLLLMAAHNAMGEQLDDITEHFQSPSNEK